ncbi:hypothetical protein ACQ4PT_055918 [Festuca glaucescens]
MERGETPNSGPPIAAAMGKSQGEATRQKRRKKKPKPDHAGLGVAPSQSPHAPNPLPAATFLQTQTQSPAPGTPILEEAAAVRKRKAAEGDKHGEEPMLAATTTKKKHKERRSSPSLSAAEEPILQQGAEVNTKRKRNEEEGPSKPLSTAQCLESPALGAQILEEATTEAAMRKRKMREEKRVAVLPFAQNQEQMEEHVLAVTMKKKKHKRKERKSSPSLTAAAAAEAPILQQEAKVTKKRLPLDPMQAQSQGTKASHASKPLSAATFLEAPTQPPASRTPMLEEAAVAVRSERKICKEQKVAALPLSENSTLGEPVLATTMMKKKKHKERKSSPSLTAAAEAPILQQEAKVTKKRKRRKEEGPSTYLPLQLDPVLTQSEGTKVPHASKPVPAATSFEDPAQYTAPRATMLEQEREADARKGSSIKKSNGKRPSVRVLSKRKLIKEAIKRQPALPEGFVPFSDFVSSCTEQNPDDSLPYGAFFDQFRYNPVRRDHKPPLPRTPDRLARLLPRANGTSKASKANNSVVCKSKKKDSGPGSASGSQEKLHPQEKKNSEKMGTKKQRQPPPLLTRAEKCSDKYRRVPLDQLVPPPRSPHNLLQEKYASDPWKVIIICMLLNLTQGTQVKKIIEGFFECYPDAHSAVNADPEKMAGYLAYLGLQRVKTTRIQKFSKEYVEKEWTYVTELCGVGKYAADAYAIFCAGRATEVVPKDHKLVDYWKYVCFELPMMQKSQNTQEAEVLEQELVDALK